MLVLMRQGATQENIQRVVSVIEDMGYQARPIAATIGRSMSRYAGVPS